MGSMNLLPTFMNRENMKSLFENDPEIGQFLVSITETNSMCTAEIAHLEIINLFAEGNFDMEHMSIYLEKYKNTNCSTDKFINNILDEIINDYNTKFLDEDYVHDEYAYVNEIIKEKNKTDK